MRTSSKSTKLHLQCRKLLVYQEDTVCSRLCLFLRSRFGRSQQGRVRARCCPLHSSVLPDKHLQIDLSLEKQSEIPPSSRILRSNILIKTLLMHLYTNLLMCLMPDLAGRVQTLQRGPAQSSRSPDCSYDTVTPPPAPPEHCQNMDLLNITITHSGRVILLYLNTEWIVCHINLNNLSNLQ